MEVSYPGLADLQLPPEEIAKFRRKFDAIDLNKDGIITLREMYMISRVFGYHLTLEELQVKLKFIYYFI